MTDYDNELRGALFKNDKKTEGDKRPNYKGVAQVAGVEYELAAWLQTSRSGEKYMQLKFEKKGAGQGQANAPAPAPAPEATYGISPEHDVEDIPF